MRFGGAGGLLSSSCLRVSLAGGGAAPHFPTPWSPHRTLVRMALGDQCREVSGEVGLSTRRGGGSRKTAGGKHSKAGYGRPVDRGAWSAKTVKRPRQQPAHLQYANYWAPLTRKRHTMPHSAQAQHTSYWAPRTQKRHQQEHRPQRPTESSNLTQHAKGRTGDCPGPRKGTTTRPNVTQGGVGLDRTINQSF